MFHASCSNEQFNNWKWRTKIYRFKPATMMCTTCMDVNATKFIKPKIILNDLYSWTSPQIIELLQYQFIAWCCRNKNVFYKVPHVYVYKRADVELPNVLTMFLSYLSLFMSIIVFLSFCSIINLTHCFKHR